MTHFQHAVRKLILFLIVFFAAPVSAVAQSFDPGSEPRPASATAPGVAQPIMSPRPGTVLRAEVLGALRPTVERETGGPVIFVVSALNVMGDWAYVSAEPRRSNGRKIDWRKTKFRRAYEADMFSGLVLALLHRRGGRWSVANYVIGPTDVAWIEWMQKHDLPEALFNRR